MLGLFLKNLHMLHKYILISLYIWIKITAYFYFDSSISFIGSKKPILLFNHGLFLFFEFHFQSSLNLLKYFQLIKLYIYKCLINEYSKMSHLHQSRVSISVTRYHDLSIDETRVDHEFLSELLSRLVEIFWFRSKGWHWQLDYIPVDVERWTFSMTRSNSLFHQVACMQLTRLSHSRPQPRPWKTFAS